MKFTTKAVLLATAFAFASPALADGNTFTYRILDEFTSVDPQLVEDVSGSEIVRDLFEGLYNQDAKGNLVPGVALSHTVSDDKLVYTFKLRPEAKWSDGTPVTAGDFVYAWQRLADPNTASEYQWYISIMNLANADPVMAGEAPLEELGVKAVDDHTLEVTLASAMSYFPLTTTHSSAFPAPKWVIDEFGNDWVKPEHIVTNGAYVLTEHVPQERSVRTRSETYWDNADTTIDTVTALVINDENVALTRFLAGELDRTEVPSGQYPSLKAQYPDTAISFPRLCSYYYMINVSEDTREPFQDVRVRQALSYAVDRDIIVDKVLQGGQFPAYTFTPGTTANFEVPAVEYSTWTQAERNAKATELLAEAGYDKSNPLELAILYNTSEAHKKLAIAVSQMWKQTLGVKVTLENQEWKTYLETRDSHDFDVSRAGWCGDYNEASTFLDLVDTNSGYNDMGYSNPEVDKLLADAKTSDNPQPNYTRVEEIIAHDMPLIPLYHYTNVFMMNPKLVESWPTENVQQNWYSKDLYFAE